MKKEKQILRDNIEEFHDIDSEDTDVLIWMIFNQVLELVTTEKIIPEFNELPEEMQRTFEEDFVFKVSNDIGENSKGGVIFRSGQDYPYMCICKQSVNFDINNRRIVKKYIDILKNNGTLKKEKIPFSEKRMLLAQDSGDWLIPEYADFCNDPEIGDYIATSLEDSIRIVVAHEMAHALQFWIAEPGFGEEDVHKNHNEVWKKYYRILRKALGLVRR